MSPYYVDTSALVKRYVDEPGSEWLRATMASADDLLLLTSRLAIVELISAFARRVREGSLSPAELDVARDMFQGDCVHGYRIMPPSMTIITLACDLLERHPLRAYDAVHLATALTAQQFLAAGGYPALTFLGADERLNQIAAAEGLAVDNPNLHR